MKRGVVLAIALLANMSLFADDAIVPAAEEANKLGIKTVSAQEAKKLYDTGTKVCDTRKKSEYVEKRIKGAIHTFYDEKGGAKNKKADFDPKEDLFDLNALPQSCIYYCNGETCWKSYKASVMAVKNGKEAYWLRGGMPEWEKSGFPTE